MINYILDSLSCRNFSGVYFLTLLDKYYIFSKDLIQKVTLFSAKSNLSGFA